MVMKQGRLRTESTVQRFAKTAIGEGFDLWDRDYLLGAMRLFLFKGETAPPFQVGPCMDATGEILVQMEEYEDAGEQFAAAAEKYAIIQQPELARLMQIKSLECARGPKAALRELSAYTAEQREVAATAASATSDGRVILPAALARALAYEAELTLKTATDATVAELAPQAVELAELACRHGWDRVHAGLVTLGDALQAAGRCEEACQAYERAVESNSSCLAALERHMALLRHAITTAEEAQVQELRRKLLELLDRAIGLHPRPTLLREKAFLLSETQGDAAALAFLDPLIANPPPEEADAAGGVGGQTVATLLKAKAAILADGGNMSEALAAAKEALTQCPGDEEATAIIAEIKQSV